MKLKIFATLEIEVEVNPDHWAEADDRDRELFAKERFEENIHDIIISYEKVKE